MVTPHFNSNVATGTTFYHDATGAFIPYAQRFCQVHGVGGPVYLDNSDRWQHSRASNLFDAIEQAPCGIECFAYFGHGVPNGLPTANIYVSDVPRLADLLRRKAAPGLRVVLYACLAATPGGFAQRLAEALGGAAKVYGHTSTAHAARNPDVTVYPDGVAIVPAGSPLRHFWAQALTNSTLWAEFPFMTIEEVHERPNNAATGVSLYGTAPRPHRAHAGASNRVPSLSHR